MPIGTGIVYNAGDLILSQVSGSGTAFLETKIAAATSSIVYFDSTARINSASLNSITVGTASYVSGSTSIITNLTASNISASGTSSFGYVGIGTTSPAYLLDVSGSSRHGYRAADTHQFTGSVSFTDGLFLTNLTASNISASGTLSASNVWFNNSMVYTETMTTGSLTTPDITFTSTATTGSDVMMRIDTTVSTGSSIALQINASGSQASYAISASNGIIAGTNYIATNITASNISASATGSFGIVGIGTTLPAYKLDVIGGTISTDSELYSLGGRLSLYRSAGDSFIDWSSGRSLGFRTETTVGGGSASEKMRIDSTGNVGIGTSSPAQKLEVQSGSVLIRGDGNALFGTYYASAGENTFFTLHSGSGNTFHIGNDVSGTNYNTMVFTAATDSTGGKVGIGTNSPGSKLQINDNTPVLTIRANDGGVSRKAYIDFYTTFFNYPSDVGARRTSTIVTGFDSGTWGTEFLAFNVGSGSANDAALLPIERVRIDGSGNLGVGTSTIIGKLQVNSTSAPYYGPATSSATANGIFILGNTTADVVNTFGVDASATAYAWIQPRKTGTATYYSLALNPNGGNVGIGTTSPAYLLDVSGSSRHGYRAADTHQFTGSVNINGSVTAISFTGSLSGSVSNALTASYLTPANSYTITNLTASNISASGYVSASAFWGTTGTFTNLSSSGPVVVSGSNAYIQLLPVGAISIPTNLSASYIYVSGSTNDLYFTQYQGPYTNTTRLRWLESNMYTGILYGGQISSTPGSTTFNIKSGSGLIVSMNATTGSDPYPTIKQVSWPDYTNRPITNSGSAKITYVGLDNTGAIVQQTNAWGSTDINQWDTQINLGVVLHLSGSVSTGVFNSPQISYGYPQKTDDFTRAFGPLKISGHTLQASGSGLSIQKTGGVAFREGSNYYINPSHPSTVVENAITASKIYRYYMSGSTPIIDTGVGNAGYTTLDIIRYNNNGVLTTLGGSYNNQFTLQRVFWIPNSPTNAFIVYYGNAVYSTLIDAQNAVNTEAFTEAPNTVLNAIQLATIVIEGDSTNLTAANKCTIVQAGLFRSVGGIGSGGTTPVVTSLDSLSDVAISGPSQGDLLTYGNGTQWVNSKILSGSYKLTGSLSTNDGVSVISLSASVVSASSLIVNNITSSGPLIYDNAVLLDYGSVSTPVVSTNYVVLQNLTGSYNSAFFDYFASSGSNFRAGTVIAGWSGSNINYTEYATTDVGNTNQLSMSVDLNGSFVRLLTRVSTTINWNIKSAGRYL